MNSRRWLLLAVAVLAVSWAGPLIRIASDVDPAVVGFWRTLIATVVLAPFALPKLRASLSSLTRAQRLGLVGSGVLLAVHFWAWIASVNMTTVASSALLVASSPVLVALASALAGRSPGAKAWVGIGLAICGGAIVVGSGVAGSMRGNLLALLGAVAAAGYLLIGSRLRERLDVIPYVFCVYGISSIVLMGAVYLNAESFWMNGSVEWLAVVALALGPQLLGHTTLNLLLDQMDPTRVAMATMAEPVGAGLIAAVLFHEIPRASFFLGAALLLLGIGICLVGGRGRGRPRVGPLVVSGD